MKFVKRMQRVLEKNGSASEELQDELLVAMRAFQEAREDGDKGAAREIRKEAREIVDAIRAERKDFIDDFKDAVHEARDALKEARQEVREAREAVREARGEGRDAVQEALAALREAQVVRDDARDELSDARQDLRDAREDWTSGDAVVEEPEVPDVPQEPELVDADEGLTFGDLITFPTPSEPTETEGAVETEGTEPADIIVLEVVDPVLVEEPAPSDGIVDGVEEPVEESFFGFG